MYMSKDIQEKRRAITLQANIDENYIISALQ